MEEKFGIIKGDEEREGKCLSSKKNKRAKSNEY